MVLDYIPTAGEVNRELGKLPSLTRGGLRERYVGPCDDSERVWVGLDFLQRSPRNAAAINWLAQMADLWDEIGLSLGLATACDTWYGGLPEGMVPDDIYPGTADATEEEFEDAIQRWEAAESGCQYFLDNAVYRFYAFNEKLLQFINGYLELGIPEGQVRGERVAKELQGRTGAAEHLGAELRALCQLQAYQHIVEARKGVTHRQHPLRGRTVQDAVFEDRAYGCPQMLRMSRQLFEVVTGLVDRLLEFVDAEDAAQRKAAGGR
jgi:hypothetical protein